MNSLSEGANSVSSDQYSHPPVATLGQSKGHPSPNIVQPQSRRASANLPAQAAKPSSYRPSITSSLQGAPRKPIS